MTQQEATAMNNRISTLEAEKEALSSENKKLQQQVAYLQKHLFGRKSEKTSVVFDGQIDLFDEAEQEAKKKVSEPELQTIKEHRRITFYSKTASARFATARSLDNIIFNLLLI